MVLCWLFVLVIWLLLIVVHVCSCGMCCGLNSVAWRFGNCVHLRVDGCIVLCSWGCLLLECWVLLVWVLGFGDGVSFVVIEYCWFS